MYYAYVVIHTRILFLSARRWPINKNWINVINTDFFLLLEMFRFKKKWKSNTLHSCFAYWYQNKQLCLSPRLIFILKEELNIKFEVEKDGINTINRTSYFRRYAYIIKKVKIIDSILISLFLFELNGFERCDQYQNRKYFINNIVLGKHLWRFGGI